MSHTKSHKNVQFQKKAKTFQKSYEAKPEFPEGLRGPTSIGGVDINGNLKWEIDPSPSIPAAVGCSNYLTICTCTLILF